MSRESEAGSIALRIKTLDAQIKVAFAPERPALKAQRRRLYRELVRVQDAPAARTPTGTKRTAKDPELLRLGALIKADQNLIALLSAERKLASASRAHARAVAVTTSGAGTTKKIRQHREATSARVKDCLAECRRLRTGVNVNQRSLVTGYLDRERYVAARRWDASRSRAGRRSSVALISRRADSEKFGAT